jgi:FkbM family methyltransferase
MAHILTFVCALGRDVVHYPTEDLMFRGMNICTLLEPAPLWFRRHLLVQCLLGVFPKSHDQWIAFNDRAKAYVDLRDPEVRNVFLKRSFEPDFIKLACAILAEGGVSFDCGANFGLCTFGLIPLLDLGHLSFHLFEANPRLIRYLEKSKSLFPSATIDVVEGCTSDRPGATRFRFDAQFTGHSHVDADGASAQANVVLDDYLESQGIDRVTFLKMDLEGQELNGLRGLSEAISRGAIEVIYFEVRSEILQRYDVSLEQILHFLYENGFRVFYCRDRDLIGRHFTTIRFARNGLNQLQLSEFRPVGGPLQTDLLAIHESLIE